MIITANDNSSGFNFSKVSRGIYHSHKIYRNIWGIWVLKINFLESRLNSSDALVSYKFKFDNFTDPQKIIEKYLNTIKL